MPELPDIEVFTRNLNKRFAGKQISRIKIVNGNKLPSKPAAYTRALAGKTVRKIFRSGKEMRFSFTDGSLLGLHLMLTGDIILFEKKNTHHSTIAEIYFRNGEGLALTDRMRNAKLTLDPVDKAGIDALSKKLTAAYLFNKLQDRKKIIKSLLTDQDFIRGIGNSYSDEILWEARISPWSIASAIPRPGVTKLAAAIKKILTKEIKAIYKNYPGKVNGEVKEFLRIHTKEKDRSPTGSPILISKKGMMKTYYTTEQKLYK